MEHKDLMADLMTAVEAERRLADDLSNHAGEWVAVRDHHVIAHAGTLNELLEMIDVDEADGVFQVAEHATASFF